MHHRPFWEGDISSARQEFPPVVYSRAHKIPPRLYVRNKVILFHTDVIRVSYTLILSFNVPLGFPSDLFLQIFKPETCTRLPSLPCPQHVRRSFTLIDQPNNNWRGINILKLLIMQFFPPDSSFMLYLRFKYLLKNKRPTWCHSLLSFISLLLCSTCFGR